MSSQPIEERPPIAETVIIEAEVLSGSISATNQVTVTIRVQGRFERPGSRVEIPPATIITTVPATVFPT